LNKVIVLGRTTKNIELKYSKNNKAYIRFTIAVNRTFKNSSGEYEADFISCIVYGKNAENMHKYVTKGDRIIIDGRIQTGSYDDNNGIRRYTTDIVCDSVQFLETKPRQETSKEAAQVRKELAPSIDVDSDSLPF
jgi:single-strand DNA-binding protein